MSKSSFVVCVLVLAIIFSTSGFTADVVVKEGKVKQKIVECDELYVDTNALVVDANGNVGIGTTSPGAKLHVDGTAGTDGIMFPDGTLQTTAAGVLNVGQGSVANGNDFNVQCGASGTVLFCLKFDFRAFYADFGVMTAQLRNQGGSSTLKTRTGRTMEYDSRYSSAHVQIFYTSTGNNAGETLTFNAYTPDGSHLMNDPDYWYIGI